MPRLTEGSAYPERPFVLVVVAGGDDERLCAALAPAAWTRSCRGNLARTVRGLAVGTGFERASALAVVTDAEADPGAALERARQALATVEPTLHTLGPAEVRLVNTRRYGVFIVPDATTPGALETLLRAWAPTPRDRCSDELFTCVGPTGGTAANLDKAWLKASTATERDPDRRPDQLVGDPINPAHAAFDDLRSFLVALGA